MKMVHRIEQSPVFKSLDKQKIWDFVNSVDVRGFRKWITEQTTAVTYHTMTSRHLRHIAQTRGIRNYSNMSKDELIIQIVRTDEVLKGMQNDNNSESNGTETLTG